MSMLELETYLAAGTTTISNVVLNHYHQIGMTQTELILYLQLMQAQQSGDTFPDLLAIAKKIGLSRDEIFELIQQMLQKKMIKMETSKTADGKTADMYDLTPIFHLIQAFLQTEAQKTISKSQEMEIQELYQAFEHEFGRALSPIELETIGYWLETDHYQVEIIKLALREAVLNQAYSLKYIDRILLNWERKNLTSKAQILAEQTRRQKDITDTKAVGDLAKDELPTIPMYNWLAPTNNE